MLQGLTSSTIFIAEKLPVILNVVLLDLGAERSQRLIHVWIKSSALSGAFFSDSHG
jgi:hypothetical protein